MVLTGPHLVVALIDSAVRELPSASRGSKPDLLKPETFIFFVELSTLFFIGELGRTDKFSQFYQPTFYKLNQFRPHRTVLREI